MVWDGDCNFCGFWVQRWRHATSRHVEFLPYQDPSLPTLYPELSQAACEQAVQLIETDGSVYSGAEAALRALAYNPAKRWPLHFYRRSPSFARAADVGYRFVARHRPFFSALTRLGWGTQFEPVNHLLVRAVFLRGLALIYLCAFLSLWTQILGLIGSHGIVPVALRMDAVRQ